MCVSWQHKKGHVDQSVKTPAQRQFATKLQGSNRYPGTAHPDEEFWDFPKSPQTNIRIILKFGSDNFLTDAFQRIIYQSWAPNMTVTLNTSNREEQMSLGFGLSN